MKPIVNTLSKKINSFFFEPCTYHNWGLFRIAVAVVSILYVFIIRNDLLNIYGQEGLIRNNVNQLLSGNKPNINWIQYLVSDYNENEIWYIHIFFIIYVALLLLLGIGLFTRPVAICVWFLNFCMINTSYTVVYGYDTFTSNCLLYCSLAPVGYTYSVDNIIRKRKNETIYEKGVFPTRILQFHLCIIYFFSGINKAVSEQWWNGEAIWRSVNQPPLMIFDMDWLAQFPNTLIALSIGTLLIETAYPVFFFFNPTRKILLVSIILLHIGIAVFLNLYFFAAIMIIMNITAAGIHIEKLPATSTNISS